MRIIRRSRSGDTVDGLPLRFLRCFDFLGRNTAFRI